MKRNLSLLLVLLCAACSALPETGNLPAGYSQTDEHWNITIRGQLAEVEHDIWLDGNLVQLLKGSPALDEITILKWLELQGAQSPRCQVQPNQGGQRFSCQYVFSPKAIGSAREIPFPVMPVLPALLNDHSILSAHGLVLNWSARIEVQGAFTQVPDPVAGSAGPGHRLRLRFQLTRTNLLEANGQEVIPPGQPARQQPFPSAAYLPNFTPTPLAWMAFGIGLAWALWVIWKTFPVRAVIRTTPAVWQPQTVRIPQPLRWIILRLAGLVNWLLRHWPRLLSAFAGWVTLFAGIGLLTCAWSLAVLNESSTAIRDWLSRLPVVIPLAPAFDLSAWSGWVYILAGAGLLCLAIAVGLFLRKEFSRILICVLLLGWVGLMLITIPARLLAPALFPFYYEVTLSSFVISFGSVLILWRAFSHPSFRNFFLSEGESQ